MLGRLSFGEILVKLGLLFKKQLVKKQSDGAGSIKLKFLPDAKLVKNFNIEDEPTPRLVLNFKHYWRQLKAWLRLERELTAGGS